MFKVRPTSVACLLLTLSIGAVSTAGQGPVRGAAKQSRSVSPAHPVASSGPTIDLPSIAPPAGTPCVVTLFNNYEFNSYSAQYFNYAPTCPGPWSKVVFNGSFNVTPGIQYDRTANIQIGYVNIYFGTTEEPSTTSGPSWTVQRDLTDYSSLFTSAQSGEVDIYNIVNSTYTGIIYGTSTLSFYPVANGGTPPVVADAVYPLPNGPGAPFQLSNASSTLSATFTLPTNVESAYLDVVSQGQQGDEFWYTCVPSNVSGELESCGGTAFRETEITIDGQPAGVAPVYPWIFTGGLDPYLWIPITGVQTLNFAPYRVNLTPFAGLLSNGQPHTVSLSVFNDNGYFQSVGTLLVYLDHGSTQVTGGVMTNEITLPNPIVQTTVNTDSSGNLTGLVGVNSSRPTLIEGYVNTSHGQVITLVSNMIEFANTQNFTIAASGFPYVQDITQKTIVQSTTSTYQPSGSANTYASFNFPLYVDISIAPNSAGFAQVTSISQGLQSSLQNSSGSSSSSTTVKTTDTLQIDPTLSYITGNSGQASSESASVTVNGTCTGATVYAANSVYTGKTTGCQ